MGKVLTGCSESSSTAIRKLLLNMRRTYLDRVHTMFLRVPPGVLLPQVLLQPLLQCSPVILHPVVMWGENYGET